jgi:predicted RNase H-like HicB family nuclease
MNDTYTVVCERSDGWWAIRVRELPGVFTQVRRLDQAEAMARDAIAMFERRKADSFAVEVSAVPPSGTTKVVTRARRAREEAEAAQSVASDATMAAAVALVRGGLTVRDAGMLLGLSHQRIAQVIRSRVEVQGPA